MDVEARTLYRHAAGPVVVLWVVGLGKFLPFVRRDCDDSLMKLDVIDGAGTLDEVGEQLGRYRGKEIS